MGGQPSESARQPEASAPAPNAGQGAPGGSVEGAFCYLRLYGDGLTRAGYARDGLKSPLGGH
jgi:hypothetical protein